MSKNKSTIDLTSGRISLGLVKFALPLMAGNVLQQCYNLTDTLVVGRQGHLQETSCFQFSCPLQGASVKYPQGAAS